MHSRFFTIKALQSICFVEAKEVYYDESDNQSK